MRLNIKGLFVGKASPLPNGYVSAIRKSSVSQIQINKNIIVSDETHDLVHHGGVFRVVHHYSNKNYNHLKSKFPGIKDRFVPGSFGENILTDELDESELCVGDIFKLGSVKLQLTVPRRPCATINHSYSDPRILKEVIDTGRVGWFYKVIDPGVVSSTDQLILLERPFPNLNILKLHEQGYKTPRYHDHKFISECLATGLMDKGWSKKIQEALSGAID